MSHPAAAYTANQPGALPGALATAPHEPLTKHPESTWSEDLLQQECLYWLSRHQRLASSLIFHIPNGGKRDALAGSKLRDIGAKAGLPDLCLPMARQQWHGLYVELKLPAGRVAPAQTAWHAALRQEGYRVEVVRSLDEFIALITDYLA